MRKCANISLHPDGYTFVSLLKCCSKWRDVEEGSKLHSHIIEGNLLEGNVYIGTALVDMYGKCGELESALKVFNLLHSHDVVSWNALIAGYVQYQMMEQALHCFERMRMYSTLPDAATFCCVLKACGAIRDIKRGFNLCALIEMKGLWQTSLHVGNATIDMYVKCGLLDRAQEVFWRLPIRNVISWTTLILGYVRHECVKEAIGCFRAMRLCGVSPDAATYSCILQACGAVKDLNMGEETLSEIERSGILKEDQAVGVAAIDMYAKCGSLEKAHQVFEMLPAQSLVAWTALLLGSVQCGHAEEGLHCFERMKLQGISPDAITFTCALKACGSIGALCKGMEIHDDIIRHKGMIGNPIIGNALIDMYARCGVLTRARGIFDKLLLRDTITWNTLLTGYSRLGEIENIVNVLYEMNANGIKPELIAITSVLNACCHAGLVDGGHMFFNYFFKDQSMIPTVEHFTCMIDLCGRAGQLDSALGIMKNAPCYPNMFTWVAVIGACRKWGNAELAMSVFKHAMPLVENEVGAYICMINIYEQEFAMIKPE